MMKWPSAHFIIGDDSSRLDLSSSKLHFSLNFCLKQNESFRRREDGFVLSEESQAARRRVQEAGRSRIASRDAIVEARN